MLVKKTMQKRIFAVILSILMVWAMVPTADAAGEPQVSYIAITSDVHGDTSNVSTWLSNNGGSFLEYIVFGGDTDEDWSSSSATINTIKNFIKNSYLGTTPIFTMGNHDWWTGGSEQAFQTATGNSRTGIQNATSVDSDGYTIYTLGVPSTGEMFSTADIDALEQALKVADRNEPFIVVSHYALHYGDGRTISNASTLIDLLNQYPNVFFFWGHNHHSDTNMGTIKVAGDTIQPTSGTSKEIKFSYCNSGHMKNEGSLAGTGVRMEILDDGNDTTVMLSIKKMDGGEVIKKTVELDNAGTTDPPQMGTYQETSTITSGHEYAIVLDGVAMNTTAKTGTASSRSYTGLGYTMPVISGTELTFASDADAAAATWTFTDDGAGKWLIGNGGQYVYGEKSRSVSMSATSTAWTYGNTASRGVQLHALLGSDDCNLCYGNGGSLSSKTVDFIYPSANNGNTLKIYEKVTGPVPDTPIDSVAITSITAPVTGSVPDSGADTPSGAKYTAGNVAWSPSVDGTFAKNTVYSASVVLTAYSGYAFSSGTTATVNGHTANISLNPDGTLTVEYAFPATTDPPQTVTYQETSTITSGHEYAIVLDGVAMNTTAKTGTASSRSYTGLGYTTPVISGTELTFASDADAAAATWTFTDDGAGKWLIGNGGQYVYGEKSRSVSMSATSTAWTYGNTASRGVQLHALLGSDDCNLCYGNGGSLSSKTVDFIYPSANNGNTLKIYEKVTPVAELTIDTDLLDEATEGSNYSKSISVTYTGSSLLTYSVTGLPAGLSMNSGTGEISGTPADGTDTSSPYSVNVTVTDGSLTDSKTYSLVVNPAPPVFVPVTDITGVPNTATVGVDLPLTGTVVPASATNQLIVWSVKNDGDTDATITGNVFSAASAGTATVTATITYGLTETSNYTHDFSITVSETPPVFVPVTDITEVPDIATVGVDLPLTGTVVPASATNQLIVWNVKNDGDTDATITGNVFSATSAGTATVTATIAYGLTETSDYTQDFSIIVSEAPPVITTATLPGGTVGTAYSQTLAATGTSPITWTVESGNLPTGLSLSTSGAITGTPSASGTFSFTVKASNNAGDETKALSITISSNSSTGGTGGGGGGGGGSAASPVIVTVKATPAGFTTEHIAYLQGYSDNTVRPQGSVTREEAAAVFFRILDTSYRETIKTTSSAFGDVAQNRWSAEYIGALVNGNILNGYADGTFKAQNFITRAELSAIAAKFGDLSTAGGIKFSDISNHWAAPYINSAVEKGWVNGYSDGTFKPDQYVTRAEFVTFINNMLNRNVNAEGILSNAKQFKDLEKGMWYYEDIMEATNSHHYEMSTNQIEKWTDIYVPVDKK